MFYVFYPTASAMAYGQSFSGPKVKIAPTVQHCSTYIVISKETLRGTLGLMELI
jgi:hypothetical protein